MKKAKKKKKKTNKKIKNISIIASLGILVILLAITIYFLKPFSNDKEIINNTLSGTERMDAQTSLVNIVKTYLNEEKIKEYVNNNNIDKLTISDLRDNFAIDIYNEIIRF